MEFRINHSHIGLKGQVHLIAVVKHALDLEDIQRGKKRESGVDSKWKGKGNTCKGQLRLWE